MDYGIESRPEGFDASRRMVLTSKACEEFYRSMDRLAGQSRDGFMVSILLSVTGYIPL